MRTSLKREVYENETCIDICVRGNKKETMEQVYNYSIELIEYIKDNTCIEFVSSEIGEEKTLLLGTDCNSYDEYLEIKEAYNEFKKLQKKTTTETTTETTETTTETTETTTETTETIEVLGALKLTNQQLEHINAWFNTWKKSEASEVVESIEKHGIDIQDVVEWMDNETRIKVFNNDDYYQILNIRNNVIEDIEKILREKEEKGQVEYL